MARTKRAAVQLEGGPQLRRALRKMDDRLGDLRPLHRRLGELVEDRARELVPRLTGALSDSIRGMPRRSGVSVETGLGLPYEGPIHFGWRERNIEPQPFLYDALDDRREEIAARYAGEIGEHVRRFDAEAPDLR